MPGSSVLAFLSEELGSHCQKCENKSTHFSHPVSQIQSALPSTHNSQSIGFVQFFGEGEFGFPHEKLLLIKVVSLLAAAGKAASDGAATHTDPFAPGAFGRRTSFDRKIHRADPCRIMLHCLFLLLLFFIVIGVPYYRFYCIRCGGNGKKKSLGVSESVVHLSACLTGFEVLPWGGCVLLSCSVHGRQCCWLPQAGRCSSAVPARKGTCPPQVLQL